MFPFVGVPVVKTFGQTVHTFKRFRGSIDSYYKFCIAYCKKCRMPMLMYTVFINSAFAFLITLALILAAAKPYRSLYLLLSFIFYVIFTPVIATKGVYLSGGEQQRIAIARVMLKDAPIIVLDEATDSLDAENETAIQSALSRLIKDKTVLLIAHRMRTVAGADKVVVLSDGRVKEQGQPGKLLAKNGIYTRMVKLQTESQSWSIE